MVLESDLVTGPVDVVMRHVYLWKESHSSWVMDPIVMDAPRIEQDYGLAKLPPDVFSSCVVTCAMAKKSIDSTSYWRWQ